MAELFDDTIQEDLFSGFPDSQAAACRVIVQRALDVASRKTPDDFNRWFSQQQKKLFECVWLESKHTQTMK